MREWDFKGKSFFLVFALLALASTSIQAQDLVDLNHDRNATVKTGMFLLGGWAVANIISAPIGSSLSSGSTKYFHQMNGYWNIVNLALASSGLYNAYHFDAAMDLKASLQELHGLEKLLLFNAGLDIGYILGGLYLIERSKNQTKNKELLRGFGQSIILQGAFLFAFDLGFYSMIHSHESELLQKIACVQLSPSGVRLSFNF